MQILRTYDSFDRQVGDFGYGWHVSLSNFRVRANRALGAGGWTMYDTQCFGICLTVFSMARQTTSQNAALFARVSPFDEAGGYGYPAPRSAFSLEALHRSSATPLLNRHPNARLHGAIYPRLDITEQGQLGQLGAIMDAVLPLHADLAEVHEERTRRVDQMEELLSRLQEGWWESSLDLQFCGPAPICLDGSLAIHTSRVTGWARSSLRLACRIQSLLDEGSLEALEQGFFRLCDAMAASYGAMDLVPIPDPFHSPTIPVFWLNYVQGSRADRVTPVLESLGIEMQRTEGGGLAGWRASTPLEQLTGSSSQSPTLDLHGEDDLHQNVAPGIANQ